jgi:hypothetical protein
LFCFPTKKNAEKEKIKIQLRHPKLVARGRESATKRVETRKKILSIEEGRKTNNQ